MWCVSVCASLCVWCVSMCVLVCVCVCMMDVCDGCDVSLYSLCLPLPEQVPLTFAALPEFLVESMADFVLFCSRFVCVYACV